MSTIIATHGSLSPLSLVMDVYSSLVDAGGRPVPSSGSTTGLTAPFTQALDLRAANVIGAEIEFVRENGTTGTWAATIVSQPTAANAGTVANAADYVRLRHAWAAGDIPNIEVMQVRAWLLLSGGTRIPAPAAPWVTLAVK